MSQAEKQFSVYRDSKVQSQKCETAQKAIARERRYKRCVTPVTEVRETTTYTVKPTQRLGLFQQFTRE